MMNIIVRKNIVKAIHLLSQKPRSKFAEKLKGRPGYRIRVGDYRIVYTIDDGKLIIIVIDIDHRKDVYKK